MVLDYKIIKHSCLVGLLKHAGSANATSAKCNGSPHQTRYYASRLANALAFIYGWAVFVAEPNHLISTNAFVAVILSTR